MRDEISLKRYIFLALVLITSIVVVIYFYMWYGEIEDAKMNISIIDEYLNEINYNELDNYLIENKNAIIYVSVLGSVQTKNFENRFKKIIEDYSLNNSILYLDLSNEYKDKDLFNKIKNKYQLLDLPCIVVFEDGFVDDVYSIEDRNYEIDLLISYLKIKGVIYD